MYLGRYLRGRRAIFVPVEKGSRLHIFMRDMAQVTSKHGKSST